VSGPSSSALAWRSGETVRAAVIALALNLVFLSPIFQHPRNWGIEDWDQHAFYHEAARISILDYGQWPQWNPWYCGGTDLLANPQSRVFDPAYPLVLALGSIVGLKIELALYAWLGLLGMYVLGRDLGLDPVSAWLAPIVYFCGPTYALPASSGMTWIMSTAYIPWVVLLFLRGPGARRAAVACGACLALMYLGGGVYPVVVTATFLGFLAIASLRAWGVAAVTRLTVAVLACSLILGAAKILPSVAFMREFPRRMDQQSGFSVQSLAFGLFHRDQSLSMAQAGFDGDHFDRSDRLLRGISTDFDDVGMYIGPLVAALAVVGLASRGRRLWPFAASIPVFVWLSFGDRPRASLFGALHTLPVFESMRYAERYRFAWLLAVCMFAGHGVRWLSCRLQRAYPGRRLGAGVATLVLAIVACDLYAITRPIYRAAFPIPPPGGAEGRSVRRDRGPRRVRREGIPAGCRAGDLRRVELSLSRAADERRRGQLLRDGFRAPPRDPVDQPVLPGRGLPRGWGRLGLYSGVDPEPPSLHDRREGAPAAHRQPELSLRVGGGRREAGRKS